ncbi:hypothetical protein BGZ68_008028 [Mortierella alpina]|nr:hypothetical protein BGZ68_008028 [Mortierella alpina]
MSETVALTKSEIEVHLNRYHQLYDMQSQDMDQAQQDQDQGLDQGLGQDMDQDQQDQDQGLDQGLEQDGDLDQDMGWTHGRVKERVLIMNIRKQRVTFELWMRVRKNRIWIRATDMDKERSRVTVMILIGIEGSRFFRPPSHKITAKKINDLSHSRKISKKREARLKKNKAAQEALRELSEKKNVIQRALSAHEVDLAHDTRRKHRQVLRAFEHSHSRRKDLHHQRLRTNRTWDKVAAVERRYVRDRGRQDMTTPPPSPGTSPPSPLVLPILFIGDAGTGVGSRIKGHDLYAKGRVLGFKRAKRNQRPDISLVQIEGVKTAADTEFYLGKRIAFVYRAKREVNGSKIRCIWGRITRSHGGSGAVKARFRNNLPAKSFGASVRVMMYPSR